MFQDERRPSTGLGFLHPRISRQLVALQAPVVEEIAWATVRPALQIRGPGVSSLRGEAVAKSRACGRERGPEVAVSCGREVATGLRGYEAERLPS